MKQRGIEILMQSLVDNLLGICEAIETDKRLSKVCVPNDTVRIEAHGFASFSARFLELPRPEIDVRKIIWRPPVARVGRLVRLQHFNLLVQVPSDQRVVERSD